MINKRRRETQKQLTKARQNGKRHDQVVDFGYVVHIQIPIHIYIYNYSAHCVVTVKSRIALQAQRVLQVDDVVLLFERDRHAEHVPFGLDLRLVGVLVVVDQHDLGLGTRPRLQLQHAVLT